ncbi:MAG: CoA-binding protein [Candidatus Aminicenantes bacterium]|nr:CoA-binding protein [Candidatus Aminicenantes bacterium]MCK5004366.1 CoA-binding protein [Candidatus Aminicenantes bacterium]
MAKIIKNIALIGASANKSKYGNIILNDLLNKGYNVFPVHPALEIIDGCKVSKTPEEIPEEVDLFVFVIPPDVGLEVTKRLYNKGYRKFWYQPGAESNEILEFLKNDTSVKFSTISCIMVNTSEAGDLIF